MVFDVIGGDILERSAALVRAGGTLVTIAEPPTVQPDDGRAVFFVVEPDRARLADLAQRLRDGRLKPLVGAVRPLAEAAAAFARHRAHPRQDDHPGRGRTRSAALLISVRISSGVLIASTAAPVVGCASATERPTTPTTPATASEHPSETLTSLIHQALPNIQGKPSARRP